MASAPQKSKKPAQPRYLQLADELRAGVLNGDFPDGFPTEQVLTDRYKVSRFTIREALKTLQAEGLITRRRGSGTTIMPAATRGGALHQPLSNVGELLQYARDTKFDYTCDGVTRIDRDVVDALGLDPEERWVQFSGLRHDAAAAPLAFTKAFIALKFSDAADRIVPGEGPIFAQLERHCGVRVASVTQDIQARPADQTIAPLLGLEMGEPVLRIIRCYVDSAGTTFEISVSHHPGDRFAYAMHHEVGR